MAMICLLSSLISIIISQNDSYVLQSNNSQQYDKVAYPRNAMPFCRECGKEVDIHKVKYHTTPDETPVHVFCDAYCSHDWHVKNKPRTGQYELAE